MSFDYQAAAQVLLEALALARSDVRLPVEWRSHARAVFDLHAKTWTPAFATLLLAKATDDTVDTMSLKADDGNPSAYSARGLCHKIIVPAAAEHQFSIRNTGREPMNNQPFFRYERIDQLDRVRNPADREFFVDVAQQANMLDRAAALEALAAFLREALAISAASRSVVIRANGLTASGAQIAVEDFLRFDAPDRPHRLQAFAAACLGLLYESVRTRRINDPSRDFPGDVHALVGGEVAVAMEVRGKPVGASDLSSFAEACESAGLGRAIMFVDAPLQIELGQHVANSNRRGRSTQIAAFTSAPELLAESFLWAKLSLPDAIDTFATDYLTRLQEIEVTVPTLQEWARTVAIAQAH